MMKAPNSNNIDQWIFEYFEGGLNTDQQAELSNFLAEHPEFNADFEAWQQATVPKEEPAFSKMEQLLAATAVGGGMLTAGWFRWGMASIVVLLMGAGAGYVADQSLDNNADSSSIIAQHDGQSVGAGLVSVSSAEEVNTIMDQADSESIYGTFAQSVVQLMEEDGLVSFMPSDADPFYGRVTRATSSIDFGLTTSSSEDDNSAINTIAQDVEEENGGSGNGIDFTGIPGLDDPTDLEILPQNFDRTPPVAPKLNDTENENSDDKDPLTGNTPLDNQNNDNDGFFNEIKDFGREIKQTLQKDLGLINLRDPYLVTPQSSALFVNPSFAGSMGVPRIEMTTRAQWPGSDVESFGTTFSVDNYSHDLNAGVGLLYSYNNYEGGLYETHHVGLAYSLKARINNSLSIEPSIKMSVNHRSVNWDKMPDEGVLEPRIGTVYNAPDGSLVPEGSSSQMFSDLTAGILINTNMFYLSATVDHIFEPAENVYTLDFENDDAKLDRRYSILFGCDFRKNAEASVIYSPQLYYQNQGDFSEFYASIGIRYRGIALGGGVSDRGSYVMSAGYTGGMFQLGYKYDRSRSWALDTRMPSHEVTLRMFTRKRDKYTGLYF